MGLNRLELVRALFSFTLRPPDSVVLRAPDFHGSGVITLSSFFSHLSQTILNALLRIFTDFKVSKIHSVFILI